MIKLEELKANIPYVNFLPSHWSIIPNRYLFKYDGIKVGQDFAKYQLLSLTKEGVKEKDLNSGGGKVPDNYINYQTVKKGQIIFCLFDLDCSAVFSGLSYFDGMITSAYDVFTPTNLIDGKYADYWFKYVFTNRYYRLFSKNIRYTVTSDMFNSLKTPVPPKEEQQRIAEFLDKKCLEIDKLIELENQQIEKLKEYKQSVISEVVKQGVNKYEHNDAYGFISIKHICPVVTDYVASGSFADLAKNVEYLDYPEYAMLVRTIDISNKGYKSEPVYINESAYKFLKNSNLFGGELILPNIGASVGDIYIVPKLYEKMSLAPNSIMIKTNQNDKYYYYYFLSEFGRYSLINLSQSAAQPKFNKTDFKKLKVLYPPIEEQNNIVRFLDKKNKDIDYLIELKNKKIEELQQYKQSPFYQ